MEFDKSRVYTALNADELKVGSKVIFADCLSILKLCVAKYDGIGTIKKILEECHLKRFFDGTDYWNLAYLVEEPEEKKLRWTDLKVGDVIKSKDGNRTAMVTEVDIEDKSGYEVYAGDDWFGDEKLANWEKVEDESIDKEFIMSIKKE